MKDSSFDEYIKSKKLFPEVERQFREERLTSVRSIISDFVTNSLKNSKTLVGAGINVQIVDGVTMLKSNDGTVLLDQNGLSLRIVDQEVKWRSSEVDVLIEDDHDNEIFHLRASQQLFDLLKTKKMLKD